MVTAFVVTWLIVSAGEFGAGTGIDDSEDAQVAQRQSDEPVKSKPDTLADRETSETPIVVVAEETELPSEPDRSRRKSAFERMNPRQQARAILGLTAVALMGFFLVFLIWLGGRATRRYIRSGDQPRLSPTGVDSDDWARKPLVPRDDPLEDV